MSTSCLIMNKVYRNRKGRDVFHLAFEYIQDKGVRISSNIPDFITNNLELLFFFDEDIFPTVNQEKVEEILDWCSLQLFKNPIAKQYFYPPCFLRNNRVINNILLLQNREIELLRRNKNKSVSINSEPLICHYLYIIILNERNIGLPNVHSKILNRKEFESSLDLKNMEMVNEFLDSYLDIRSFVGIYSTSLVPSFLAGLDKRRRVLFAIVTHVPGVNAYII